MKRIVLSVASAAAALAFLSGCGGGSPMGVTYRAPPPEDQLYDPSEAGQLYRRRDNNDGSGQGSGPGGGGVGI